MQPEEIEKRFTYHPPHGSQIQRYEYIRSWAKWLASHICAMTPESREQSLAITALEECVFWSNAAIARNERQAEQPTDPNTLYPDVLTAQHPTLAELEQKLDFHPSPPITLPPGADPHDWPTVAPFLRGIGALAAPNNLYTFKYDLPEGKRGGQDIIAATLEDAFKRFGSIMEQFNLHPHNIHYEIEEQRQAITGQVEEAEGSGSAPAKEE